MKRILGKKSALVKKIKEVILFMIQRLWISYEQFLKNGMANHASAGAYGFLLSAAPALLIIYFIITRVIIASPELMFILFQEIGSLSGIIDANDLADNFFKASHPGIGGFFSVLIIFWSGRICALSVRRGLGVIFSGPKTSPLKDMAITFGMESLIILYIFIIIFGSQTAKVVSILPDIPAFSSFSFRALMLPVRVVYFASLPLITLAAYRSASSKSIKWKYLISGVITCVIPYEIFARVFMLLVKPDRYNLLYGTMGMLFLFLVNVYFFFFFFFFGAQLAVVMDSTDALIFTRFRQLHSRNVPPKSPLNKLFSSSIGVLKKYIKIYKQGEVIFRLGSPGKEVYYILNGDVGVYLDNECQNRISAIGRTHFFGEMENSPAEGRSATIKAETDLSVMILPYELFRKVLKSDPDTDQKLIKDLSERLRAADKQVISLND
jgi:membrane protein